MTKYIFWAGIIEGLTLTADIEVYASNYTEALHKVIKIIVLEKVDSHLTTSAWPW